MRISILIEMYVEKEMNKEECEEWLSEKLLNEVRIIRLKKEKKNKKVLVEEKTDMLESLLKEIEEEVEMEKIVVKETKKEENQKVNKKE